MILYHGSDKVVEKPLFGVGRDDNDYGSGFYTTESIERAREWAWINGSESAFCNKYEIDISELNLLKLEEYGALAWIAEVVMHRGGKTRITSEMGERLVRRYKLDTSSADIIIGYRADDSYIDVVEAFLGNLLSIDEVERQFKKGGLGYQIFIKSRKAFDSLSFLGYEKVEYSNSYGNSDLLARKEVSKFLLGRETAVLLDGFAPQGITAREAINGNFLYDKENNCYLPDLKGN
ncbi:MAG: DUF3990 domain-containing protein [Bacteroides sp.]|nr:DUF3990 domain-containing protein [Bacteroides sp.]